MGKAFSIILRPLKNYNVQSRAHKVLDEEKPRLAPRHSSERQWKEANNGLDKFQVKDDRLANNLKSVYVVSQDTGTVAKDSLREDPSIKKQLPSYRRIVNHPPLGYIEPDRVTEGKVSLMKAINFIMEHQSDPKKVTAQVIASTHKLDEEIVVKVLRHFSAFELHLPEQNENRSVVQRITELPKMLFPKSEKES